MLERLVALKVAPGRRGFALLSKRPTSTGYIDSPGYYLSLKFANSKYKGRACPEGLAGHQRTSGRLRNDMP